MVWLILARNLPLRIHVWRSRGWNGKIQPMTKHLFPLIHFSFPDICEQEKCSRGFLEPICSNELLTNTAMQVLSWFHHFYQYRSSFAKLGFCMCFESWTISLVHLNEPLIVCVFCLFEHVLPKPLTVEFCFTTFWRKPLAIALSHWPLRYSHHS